MPPQARSRSEEGAPPCLLTDGDYVFGHAIDGERHFIVDCHVNVSAGDGQFAQAARVDNAVPGPP
jgi:hypothetical protein